MKLRVIRVIEISGDSAWVEEILYRSFLGKDDTYTCRGGMIRETSRIIHQGNAEEKEEEKSESN